MNKQNPIHDASPAELPGIPFPIFPRDMEADLKAVYEQAREAIAYHSSPEKMTPAQLFDIDDL